MLFGSITFSVGSALFKNKNLDVVEKKKIKNKERKKINVVGPTKTPRNLFTRR